MRTIALSLLALALAMPLATADLTNVLVADDAGTGTDAPELPSGRIVVAPATLYHGAIQAPTGAGEGSIADPFDLYTVPMLAGQTIDVWARGLSLAIAVMDDAGNVEGSDVVGPAYGLWGSTFVAPTDGRYHIEILGSPQPYCFAFRLDGGPSAHVPPPEVASCSLGLAVPSAPGLASPPSLANDAGSGRDAPSGPEVGLPIAAGVAYEGMLAGAREGSVIPREDVMDAYAFEARAGQRIDVTYLAPAVLAQVLAPDGTSVDTDSSTGYVYWDGLTGTATVDGTYLVRFLGPPQGYCFQVSLDATVPADLVDAPRCVV